MKYFRVNSKSNIIEGYHRFYFNDGKCYYIRNNRNVILVSLICDKLNPLRMYIGIDKSYNRDKITDIVSNYEWINAYDVWFEYYWLELLNMKRNIKLNNFLRSEF